MNKIIQYFCLLSIPFWVIHASAQNALEQAHNDSLKAFILTPPSSKLPAIHGAKVFGARANAPFMYAVPATGDRPMLFTAKGLPDGLRLDQLTGIITGKVLKEGNYEVTLLTKNKWGKTARNFKIVIGENLSLTPAMGWNSWNCWAGSINQERVINAAKAFIKYKLNEHGWTFINMDDGWQGIRGGAINALQADPKKFPNMKAVCDSVHALGLKVGIYSTSWVRSYAGRLGGSAENEQGLKDSFFTKKVKLNANILPAAIGKYSFATQDAQQWADWGIDYLKYDWAPVTMPPTKEMYEALKNTKRDIILSLSNNGPNTLLKEINEVKPYAESWRTTTDINDSWKSVSSIGFNQDKWAYAASPGHWNDPDMLVVGYVGWGKPHPTKLTPDEQYAHISLWCLLSAPLLLGCDLEKLDPFTLSLITNDEVIDIDQDALGKQATKISSKDSIDIFAKPLEDGNYAVGIFNRSINNTKTVVNWSALNIASVKKVRDVWRQQDIGDASPLTVELAPHGATLYKVFTK